MLSILSTLSWIAVAGPPVLASAPAGEGRTVAVSPIAVDGPLAEGWMDTLRGSLVEGVRRGDRPILEPDALGETCADDACWAARASKAGASFVVVTHVVVDDRDFDAELSLLDATGTVVATAADSCEVCAVPEAARMLGDLAGVLNTKLDALDREPPKLTFVSTPPSARIYVDGELVGEAPVTRDVTPGRHRARAELPGSIPLDLFVDAVAGSRETVEFELDPVPRRQRARPLGWGLLAVGIAGVGTGVPLLILDERPYRKRCDGPYVDREGNCRFRYDTLAAGIASTSVGAASLIAGAVILGLSRPDKARRTTAGAMWLPGTGAGVVLRGRL